MVTTFLIFPLRSKFSISSILSGKPAGNYMFKVDNRRTKTRSEVCSELTIRTSELWACWDCRVSTENFGEEFFWKTNNATAAQMRSKIYVALNSKSIPFSKLEIFLYKYNEIKKKSWAYIYMESTDFCSKL